MKDEVENLLEYFNKKIDSEGKLVGISYEDFMLRYNHALPFLSNEYYVEQSPDFLNRYDDLNIGNEYQNYLSADYSYVNFMQLWGDTSIVELPAPPRGYVTHEYADLFKQINWESFHAQGKDQLFKQNLIALQENVQRIKEASVNISLNTEPEASLNNSHYSLLSYRWEHFTKHSSLPIEIEMIEIKRNNNTI